MSKPRFIKLRSNGVTFSLDAVRLIARKDLNEYSIVLEGTNVMPRADAGDVEYLESLLDIEVTPEPAPMAPTKLAVAE